MENTGNTRIQTTNGYEALKEGAALVQRSGRAMLRLSGKDPVGMLNAILTNEVPRETGQGVYALLLNPKGRIQTDLRIIKSGDGVVLVDTEPEGAAAAREILGRYAPFSRVKVESLSEGDAPWGVLGLYGPRSPLDGVRLAEHASEEVEVGGAALLAVGVALPVPGFDLLGPEAALRNARGYLVEHGAIPASLDAYETIRIEAGIPRFGADITPENFPAEAGIVERSISFTKGCYPGQETVARMRYRGHPNKTLHRLAVEGPRPEPGAEILQVGKRAGVVTSIAPLPVDGRTFALGYLSRKADLEEPLRAGDAGISPQVGVEE